MAKKDNKFMQMALFFEEPAPEKEVAPPSQKVEEVTPPLPVMEEAPKPVPEPEVVQPSNNSTPASETIGFRIKSLKTPVTAAADATPPPVVATPPPSIATITRKPTTKPSTRGRKSIKVLEASLETLQIPADDILFQKQYYAIGDVAAMFQENTSLIRFWTNEFDMIKPRLNRKGDRLFRPVDIKNLQLVHELLRRKKLTIQGAKDFLKGQKKMPPRTDAIATLQKIRGFLVTLQQSL